MPLERSARVARTAYDLAHRNRLRPTYFAVTDLHLEISRARSRCHLPAGFTASAEGQDTFHFAPEAEQPRIAFTIADPLGLVRRGRLELFRRGSATALWTRDLSETERTHGEHTIEWNGATEAGTNFPDGFVTVEHSPYKLKLSLNGDPMGNPPVAWTYFHVLVHELELELGARDVLAEDRDRTLYDTLGGALPGSSETKDVRLLSNIFKTSGGEMNDNSLFTQYQSLWGDGPNIPVFAKVWIKNSQDQRVEAPKALGNVRFLWDWEDVAEDTSGHHAKAQAFLDAALDYDKQTTQPKGDNCHKDRGGKRGPAARPVFPPQAGYAAAASLTAGQFPFPVEAATTRQWAVLSRAWGTGAAAGKTGVLFQAARTAGDAYKVTVHLAHDKRPDDTLVLDVTDDAPLNAAVKQSSGTFQVWREVHLISHTRKTSTVSALSVGTFQGYYEKAGIKMENRAGAARDMPRDEYNTRVASAVAAQSAVVRAAVDSSVDQHGAGTHAVEFRAHADFLTAYQTAQGWTAAQLQTWLAGTGSAYASANDYHAACKEWAKAIVTHACDVYMSASDGINLMQFQGLYNLETQPGGLTLNGFAADFPSASRSKCAFVLSAGAGNYGADSNTAEQTVTHEVGHHMMLPHAPFPAADPPPGSQANAHDDDWPNCMMSYNYSQERKFCGFCILRMRGWDKTVLSPTAASNRRT